MSAADGGFVTLAALLRQAGPAASPADAPGPAAPAAAPEAALPLGAPRAAAVPTSFEEVAAVRRRIVAPSEACGCERSEALRAARLFRAAVAEAFEAVVARLARDFAHEVLGRELRLAAPDLAAIARRIIEERRSDEPLRLRVAPADAELECEIPVVADPRLAIGDAILECSSGEVEMRLALRLADALTEALR